MSRICVACSLLSLLLSNAAVCDAAEKRVLVYTRNYTPDGKGYVHDNIKAGVEAIQKMGKENGFAVDVWHAGEWKEYAAGQSIGACRLLRGDKVKSDRVRLRITHTAACPCISDVGLFITPPGIEQK